jgi:hypothetical protein
MHLYYWDKKRLEKTLVKFIGGQFLMETKEGLVFRGEISEYFVPDNRNKMVIITFNWLSERRLVSDANWNLVPKWYRLKPPIGHSLMNVGFTTYYSQPDEDRLKMWGEQGEVCHFFRKEDHTNLVSRGDEFVPYWQLHHLLFCRAIITLLFPKQR